MAKTVISLPGGDFHVVGSPWPNECVSCWFALHRVSCVGNGIVSCYEFCDYDDVTEFRDAILVPNFGPA